MGPAMTVVTERIHVAHTPLVNWTLVSDDAGVMLIDAGYPGNRDDVLASLKHLGYEPADVTAILLTHAHIDHLGAAIWFAKTHNTPVYCHAGEVGHAKREYLEQVSPVALLGHLWKPRWLRWSVEVVGKGGLVRDGIPTTRALTPEIAATLPGRPQALPTPGHTRGHCSYLVDGVLVTGDALVTGHPLSTTRGPQLLPAIANHDQAQCVRSLSVLATAGTETLIPGHGDIWIGPIAEAVQRASA
jgi:glyoxylase-like metal-dependent hydrolase (beta-lactamase superfamily II)